MFEKHKKVLVVAAHPDDEVLGCGGTIRKFTKKGAKVKILFISDGETSRKIKNEKRNKKINLRKKAAIKAGTFDPEGDERFTFHESDLRYKHIAPVIKENTAAVIFFVMDVSGSMTKSKKFLAILFHIQ